MSEPKGAVPIPFDPIALHRGNCRQLRDGDVIVAAYPGSGNALLGNLLLELEVQYVDLYTERLHYSGRSTPVAERVIYRSRLSATAKRDRESNIRKNATQELRFAKTHLYPSEFNQCCARRVLLLVRDPRDAIFSYYNWRLGFSEEGEYGTFREFLDRRGFSGRKPCDDWSDFYSQWLANGRERAIVCVRFEDLKKSPNASVQEILGAHGIRRSRRAINAAVEASRFSAMRAHEDRAAREDSSHSHAYRIMRKGATGAWRDWYSSDFASFFETGAIAQTAKEFGYEIGRQPALNPT